MDRHCQNTLPSLLSSHPALDNERVLQVKQPLLSTRVTALIYLSPSFNIWPLTDKISKRLVVNWRSYYIVNKIQIWIDTGHHTPIERNITPKPPRKISRIPPPTPSFSSKTKMMFSAWSIYSPIQKHRTQHQNEGTQTASSNVHWQYRTSRVGYLEY